MTGGLGSIIKVSGPAVTAGNMLGCFMSELVRVGANRLRGEIIITAYTRMSLKAAEMAALAPRLMPTRIIFLA